MSRGRLEAFSDGVIAILITIMVLELKVPTKPEWSELFDLHHETGRALLTYGLSFVSLGIYWMNHHHLLHTIEKVSGGILWANLHLLFWLSLVPFTAFWMNGGFFPVPTAAFGIVQLGAAVAFFILVRRIIVVHGPNSRLARAIGRDYKGKVSLVTYAAGTALAFVQPWVAIALYLLVGVIWLIPDRRIERTE